MRRPSAPMSRLGSASDRGPRCAHQVGGILVGPYDGEGGSQRLIECVRVSEDNYSVRELMSVRAAHGSAMRPMRARGL